MALAGAANIRVVAGLTTRFTWLLVLSAGVAESVAFTVTVEVPDTVGVPLTMQLEAKVRPAGKVPAVTEQVYGAVPPVTPSVAL